jgi:hypothetical protein
LAEKRLNNCFPKIKISQIWETVITAFCIFAIFTLTFFQEPARLYFDYISGYFIPSCQAINLDRED